MKMTQKWKRFWTLNHKANAGFTLVELIVVIAILAILGGVAVPVYSGYIKRADRAADEALLDAVNTAFASACIINGESNYDRNDITVANAKIDGGAFVYTGPFAAEFAGFYEGGTFKVIDRIIYDASFGGFKDPATAESMKIAYGDGFVQVSGAAINALLNSTYYADGMGSETLMNQVDRVAGIAGAMGTVANVKATHEYVKAVLAALGAPVTDTFATNAANMSNLINKLALEKMGLTDMSQIDTENQAQFDAYTKSISDNALVIYTAQSTSNMSAEDAKNLLNGVDSTMIKDAMDGNLTEEDKAKGMNQAALAYGMYYAYVNSSYAPDGLTDEQKKNPVAMDVIDALNEDPNFRTYMDSDQGTKDMEAYLEALKVINSSAQSPDAAEKIMVDGFANQELIDILENAMGK